jgi:nucleoside-diphosphate-sugar epimerase
MERIIITGGNGFIGTNLLLTFRDSSFKNSSIYIVDTVPPKISLQENERWINLDILEEKQLKSLFVSFKPHFVIHLAAKTDCDPLLTLNDYLMNTVGSKNVFEACEAAGSSFLVNTSSQFVNQSGRMPLNDLDYAPHTVYGESKIIAEKFLRDGNYSFNWVIVRPTNIWGRWHLRYPVEFWKVVRQGRYFHPGKQPVKRSYGYVGNVCDQIIKLIESRESSDVSKQVFYLGDEVINLFDWVNSFSLSIANRPARVVPRKIVYLAALTGSALHTLRIKFPITLSRYRSMTSNNGAPMEKTFGVLGSPRYSMQEGVSITTNWLNEFWKENKV